MTSEITRLSELMSPTALKLLSDAGGNFVVQQIGMDVIRSVVFDVLTGKNLRDSTEVLTRRRISVLNLALLQMFVRGQAISSDFVQQLPYIAAHILASKRISKTERWLAQWALGLTSKAVQNVLTDDVSQIAAYRDQYIDACREVIAKHEQEFGILTGSVGFDSGDQTPIDGFFLTYLLNAIGSQTLTIRGSEKSAYGKLFEKLILGSLLAILDFQYVPFGELENPEHVLWLSSRGAKRESDATLFYEAGKGVRFDIGFIGRGNSEISLDKVSRFEREIRMGRSNWYMATIILVDRIPQRSRIEEMAREIDGTIVQMSGGYWPQRVARELQRVLGYEHELIRMEVNDIDDYLREKLKVVPFDLFI